MAKTLWGIDVATTGVKIAQLSVDGGNYALRNVAFFPTDGEFGPEWAPRLKAFCASRKLRPSNAVVALGGKDMVIDITSIPRGPIERLEKMVAMHVGEFEERNEESLSYDWSMLRIPARDEVVMMLGMAKDSYLERVLNGLQAAGISVSGFVPTPVAQFNAFVKFGPLYEKAYVYLIDLGEKTLSVSILREGVLLFSRTLQSGLDLFIEPLMGALEVKRGRAMRYLVEEGKVGAGGDSETLEYKSGRALMGATEQLGQMLASSIKFCQVKTKLMRLEPEHYVLSGGGARMNGLADQMARSTRKQVELFDPSDVLPTDALDARAIEDYQDGLPFTIALGAAQMASGEAPFPIEIKSATQRKKKAFYSQTLVMVLSLTVTVLLLVLAGVATRGRLVAEQQRKAELGDLAEQYSERKNRREALDAERDQLQAKLVDLKSRVAPGSRYFRAVSLIQQVKPEPIWLTRIQLAKVKTGPGVDDPIVAILRIHGTVEESNQTVNEVEQEFVQALKADPVIKDVIFKNRTDDVAGGRSTFQIEVSYHAEDAR